MASEERKSGIEQVARPKSKTAWAIVIVLVLLMSAMVAVCGTGKVLAVDDEYVQIRVGTILEPDDFNPFSMTTGMSYTIAWMMYEMLYTSGPEREPCPQLAQSYKANEDGTVWTYYLVEDSFFHDDIQVTAHDVAFTFNMIMENEDDCALLGGYLKGFQDVTAIDDFTVQITLDAPKATMLAITVPILPEHLWSAVVDAGEIKTVDLWDPTFFPDGPVGSGPMILSEYSKTSGFIKLLKQDPYHRLQGIEVDSINVDEILFVIYKNEAAMTTALVTGEIDVVDGVPELLWETLMENPDIDGQAPAALDLTDVGFNCASQELRESVDDQGHPNFPSAASNLETTNLSVRQAVTLATNRTQIVDEILQGLGQEADSLIPTATPFWHYYVPDEEKFPFDIDAANALLDPWYSRDDDKDGIRENDTSGAELEFEFYYISATARDELSAGKIADWCAEIGIQLNLHGVAEGTLYNMWFNLEYDMFIWNWQPDVDPSFLLSVLTTDEIPVNSNDITAWSDCFYSNPVYDQLYDDQLGAMDPFERQGIIHEMQRIVYRDCPYICLWYPCSLIAYRTDEFMDFPDMERYTGSTPDTIWFYFEVKPYVEGANTPPYDVDAGEDTTVYVGDELTFSGSAEDLDNSQSELNWTWLFADSEGEEILYEQTISYTFDLIGVVHVTLSVSDPEGLSSSDSLEITVIELPEDEVGRLQGYVMDEAGEPIVGASVKIIDDVIYDRKTDETGLFNATVLADAYQVNATAKGYSTETGSAVVVAGDITWLNFTLEKTSGSVAGHILDSAAENPVSGALVKLFRPGEVNSSYAKKTDANGLFQIDDVDAGVYEVVVTATGFETNDTETVNVIAGEVTNLDILLTAIEEDDGGLSTMAAIGVAMLAIIAAIAVAVLLLKRRKGSEPQEDRAPEHEGAEHR
jgi:peptide/nickel transport system substrate-binding protein